MTDWILWSLMFATLVAVSALAAERIAAQHALPRRFIWMVAILVIAFVPTALAVRPVNSLPVDATTSVEAVRGSSVTMFELTRNSATVALPPAQLIDAPPDVDLWSLRIWVMLSVAVFCTFAYSTIALKRKSARWLEVDLKLCRALIANDVGPAVIGFLRPRVVVPQWALHVPESARQMILHHEVEHLRARDPQALFASGIPLIALPWNLPLWWIVRRMRVAMELDCDARVVRRLGQSYEYGQVLLAVGERHIRSIPLAASMTGRRSLLEWRIKAMTMKKPRRPLLASIPFAAFAFVALTAATRVSPPAPLVSIASASASASDVVADPVVTQDPAPLVVATPAPTPARSSASVAPSVKPIARAAQQKFPTRAQIAAVLKANVPGLSDPGDSSNYAVLVLDANYNFAAASAGFGNVTIQVWGDTLDNNARAVRTSERTGVPVAAPRAGGGGAGGGARGGGGGVAVDSTRYALAGTVRRRAVRTDSAITVGRGGRGAAGADTGRAVAFRRTADTAMLMRYRDTLARRIARRDTAGVVVGGRGAGAAAGAASGAVVDSSRYATAFARAQRTNPVQRSVFRSGNGNFILRGATNNGPSHGYAAGFTYQPGPNRRTGVQTTTLMNSAPGLHGFQIGVDDDSGIDGILASTLTSLETFKFESELGPRVVDVMVVTKK